MRVWFMGTSDFAVPCLDALLGSHHEILGVLTQPDSPAGRGRRLKPPPIKVRAVEAGLNVYQPEKPLLRGSLLEGVQPPPDLVLVVAYGHLLGPDLLKWPARGCVNLHASLLPRLRGAAPINWSILNGETETGVTTLLMTERLDAGPILLQRSCPILPEDTTESLSARLAGMGASLCLETFEVLEDSRITPQPQEETLATYAPKLKKADGVIDWSLSAEVICQKVRAFRPWPVAQTSWGDGILLIWSAHPSPAEAGALPGTVLGLREEGIGIAALDGTVIITEIQAEGGKRMEAQAFWRGHPLLSGTPLA